MTDPKTDRFKTNPSGFRRDQSAPSVAVPPGACDTHMHIVGPFAKYPLRETRSLQPPESVLEDYRAVMQVTGIQRNVIVQPSFFGMDNECTLDSTVALGLETTRAVVVVNPDISEKELESMHHRGARAVRIQSVVAGGARIEDIETLAVRIRPLGWHIQTYMDANGIEDLAPVFRRLPVDVVFDHMAHVHRDSRPEGAGFNALLGLLESGKAWVKLSNARFVADGERARLLVQANPEHAVWGSDWPHVSYEDAVPTEGMLLDALAQWVPDEATRNRILVDNATNLYFK